MGMRDSSNAPTAWAISWKLISRAGLFSRYTIRIPPWPVWSSAHFRFSCTKSPAFADIKTKRLPAAYRRWSSSDAPRVPTTRGDTTSCPKFLSRLISRLESKSSSRYTLIPSGRLEVRRTRPLRAGRVRWPVLHGWSPSFPGSRRGPRVRPRPVSHGPRRPPDGLSFETYLSCHRVDTRTPVPRTSGSLTPRSRNLYWVLVLMSSASYKIRTSSGSGRSPTGRPACGTRSTPPP